MLRRRSHRDDEKHLGLTSYRNLRVGAATKMRNLRAAFTNGTVDLSSREGYQYVYSTETCIMWCLAQHTRLAPHRITSWVGDTATALSSWVGHTALSS